VSLFLIVLCLTSVYIREAKFASKLKYSQNILCKLFLKNNMQKELSILVFLVRVLVKFLCL